MSTATAPAAITVPREFLPAFAAAEDLRDTLGDLTEHHPGNRDADMEAITAKACLLRDSTTVAPEAVA